MASERPPENSRDGEFDLWLQDIKARWERVPEFRVDTGFHHLAVICDGNRRSATERGFHPWQGHRAGIEVIRGIMQACKQWGINTATFWTWSTENWKRDQQQVGFVMGLAAKFLADNEAVDALIENQARFKHIGRTDRLPLEVREAITNLERVTENFATRRVNLALDYGGADEIARATARVVEAGVDPQTLRTNPDILLDFLDTAGQPLPNLVLRTGCGPDEIPHTSGFMPLQTTYAGWLYMPTNFPDLTPETLATAIQEFQQYEMRKGK